MPFSWGDAPSFDLSALQAGPGTKPGGGKAPFHHPKIGDKAFGGTTSLGCYAEYVCVKEDDVITTIPETISYEEAAPDSGSAITVLRLHKI